MAKLKSSSSIDMTQGSPYKLILVFSLPLIAGSILQQLYNMVDSMVVGRFVGTTALAAVGAAFPIIFMVASLFMGLGNGAMVMVSQYYGGNERENLQATIDTVYTSVIVAAIPVCVAGILLTNPILDLISIPADARDEAYLYLVILMGGLIGTLGYNCNAGILQGLGDSRTPVLFLVISCLINVGLDLFLVLVIPWGVAGVAIATVVAQLFSWIFGIFYINHKYPEMRIRPFCFRFSKDIFKQIMRLGIPSGVQMSLFSLGSILMSRLVNQYGSIYAAGFSGANKLDTFAFLPIQSIATAITTYTGQNVGGGRLDRVNKGIQASLVYALVLAVLGLLVIPAGPALMRMFTDDPAVIEAGMAFINRIMPFYWMLSISFIFNSVMRGAGEAMIPMISSLVGLWIARLPAAYLLAHFFGRDNLHFSYMVGWLLSLCITVPYFIKGRWRHKAITRAGSAAETALPDAEPDG